MAEPAHTTGTEVPEGEHGAVSAVPLADVRFAAGLARDRLRPLYVMMAKFALPRVGSIIERRQKRIAGDVAEAERLKAAIRRGGRGLRKSAGRCARPRADNRQRDSRAQQAADEPTPQEARGALNVKLAEAEKSIAATKQAAMANVRGIADDAATRHRRAADRRGAERKGGRRSGRRRAQAVEDRPCFEAEIWVALAFVIFLGVLGYLGVHRMIVKSLDDRADRIKAELDEARKLKDEAAQLLADYQRKRRRPRARRKPSSPTPTPRPSGWRSRPRPRSRNSSPAAPRWPRPRSPRPRRRPSPTCAAPPPKPPSPPPRRS